MRRKIEITPPNSPKQLENERLRQEAEGILAAVKPGSFFDEKKKELIEKYVHKGVEQFDSHQDQDQDDDLIFDMSL